RQVIEKEPDLEIVGVASDGEEAVAKTNELEPDVLVIEVDLPRLSGIKATQRVRRELPAVGVVILTAQDQEQILFEAIRAGEVAYALAIDEQTVKNHMSSMLRELSVNDRTQAVVYAIRQGWIKGPEIGN